MKNRRITLVHHTRVEIACPPLTLWNRLCEDIAEGEGFARFGYRIEPIDDPAVPLGGYRMKIETADLVDERLCRVTERDDAAMRLSMHADYLSPDTQNIVVYVTYEAVPTDRGCLYRLDCHATLDHAVADDMSREDIAKSIAVVHERFDQGLVASGARIKASLETEAAEC